MSLESLQFGQHKVHQKTALKSIECHTFYASVAICQQHQHMVFIFHNSYVILWINTKATKKGYAASSLKQSLQNLTVVITHWLFITKYEISISHTAIDFADIFVYKHFMGRVSNANLLPMCTY
jgi:hypothetical protein